MRAISCSPELLDRAKLQTPSRVERVAFFLAEPLDDRLRLVDVRPMGRGDFDHRTGEHVSLADPVRPELIAWAWERDLCLVEAHTHPGGDSVCLSRTDIQGLAEWVPHLWWRLRGRPYAALVFGPSTVDAVGWRRGPSSPEGVAALEVDGRPPQVMTGLSLRRMERQVDCRG